MPKTNHNRCRVIFKTTLAGELRSKFIEECKLRDMKESELLRDCVREKLLKPITPKR